METNRLIIRNAKISDVDDIFEMRNSEFVLKYNAMKVLTYEQMSAQVCKDVDSSNSFCLELKETGKVIGKIDLDEDSLRYGVNSLCISYYLNENYASKGYMFEALNEVIRHVFEDRKIDVLSVRVFKENNASRLLVEKLGFKYEGCIRMCVKGYNNVVYDDLIFSMIKDESTL